MEFLHGSSRVVINIGEKDNENNHKYLFISSVCPVCHDHTIQTLKNFKGFNNITQKGNDPFNILNLF
ncbi:hypothetical protein VNO78_24958 [Psophocarpus tetragonolobus]|uniref:Uncharacterized protein n=1 Tax=Psophocarpus tetragonolobus TaxID=3891 RepID=A0AAN9S544_PSOTE